VRQNGKKKVNLNGFYEYGNELSGSIKFWEVPE
jgi:hypothetical protein